MAGYLTVYAWQVQVVLPMHTPGIPLQAHQCLAIRPVGTLYHCRPVGWSHCRRSNSKWPSQPNGREIWQELFACNGSRWLGFGSWADVHLCVYSSSSTQPESLPHPSPKRSLVQQCTNRFLAPHLTQVLMIVFQEVTFMTSNRDSLTNGLLASLEYQKDVSAVKLTEQTKVGLMAGPFRRQVCRIPPSSRPLTTC